MTEEPSDSRDIHRGQLAQQALDNEVLNEAWVLLRNKYIQEWGLSGTRDTEGRERLWQAVKVLDTVKSHLQSVVKDGKIAARAGEQVVSLGERKKFLNLI